MHFSRIRYPRPGLSTALFLAAFAACAVSASFCHAEGSDPPAAPEAVWCQPWNTPGNTGSALVSAYDPRPPDGAFILSSAHFRIHYEEQSLDGYAQLALESAEESYAALIDSLGYAPPPSDNPNGGDGRTDFYILPAGSVSYAGRTVPEQAQPNGPYLNAWTSYVEIVDSMSASLLPVVVVHEYFHVIQVGYDKDENTSFLEMISVWSEDYLYDGVNRYLRYLNAFFAQPQVRLMGWTYNNVVWAKFLSENFGDQVVADILDRCGKVLNDNALAAMDDQLTVLGSSLADEFARFTLWNYFTGPRDDGLHYEEGGSYPAVRIEHDTECMPLENYATQHSPAALASNYLMFLGDRAGDSLSFELALNPNAEWVIGFHSFVSGLVNTRTYYFPQTTGWDPHEIVIDSWGECDSLLVITNVVSRTGSDFDYIVSAMHAPAPPPELPYVLVFDRDNCARPFDGVNDEFSRADGEAYPHAAALDEKTVRYLLSDSLPADLSMCGAIFLVGGFDGGGCNLEPAELQAMMDFMDAGGDLYLESTRLGAWIDPLQGSPSPLEAAFWEYFGCRYLPGNPMSTGNVSAWETAAGAPFPVQRFAYDYQSAPDDFAGVLVPGPGADTLIVDQSGIVRGTIAHGANESERVCATVMLGGSVADGGLSSRGDYIRGILNVFDTIIPALAVAYFDYFMSPEGISFAGEVEGWNGQRLVLKRASLPDRLSSVEIPVDVSSYGSTARLSAKDDPDPGSYLYTLRAVEKESERLLWERVVAIEERVTDLSAVSISPNPSSGGFQILISAAQSAAASLDLYDASGRKIRSERALLFKGSNTVLWPGAAESGESLPAGIYFLRIESGAQRVTRKLVVLR